LGPVQRLPDDSRQPYEGTRVSPTEDRQAKGQQSGRKVRQGREPQPQDAATHPGAATEGPRRCDGDWAEAADGAPADEDSGTRPVLAAYANRPKLLRGRYKGKLHRARVLRDGRIRYDGKTFNSPSLAAAAARGRPTANGWWFWTYQRAPGEWVRLGELRR
jgi:hypothetical protein